MKYKSNIFAGLLFIVYLAGVAYCCFGHFSSLPNVQRSYFGIPTDKIVHFIMFFPFPVLCFLTVDNHRRGFWRRLLLAVSVLAAGCALAAATEIGQSFTTYRSGDKLDWYADFYAMGSCTVLTLLVDLILPHKKRR